MTFYPANAKYQRDKLLRVQVNFNRNTEPDLVERVEREGNKSGYIKGLIREDIAREEQGKG